MMNTNDPMFGMKIRIELANIVIVNKPKRYGVCVNCFDWDMFVHEKIGLKN